MKKKILIPAFALVLALCLSACSGREFEIKHPGEEQSGALSENSELEHGEEESAAPEQGETSESQTSAAEETEKTPAPTLEEAYCEPIETLEVYRFYRYGGVYSHVRVDFSEREQTILEAINTAAKVLPFVEVDIPVKSVTIQKSYVTVDFKADFTEKYYKGEQDEIFNTVGMTLFKNGICDSICFSLEGDSGVFGGENYQIAPFAVAPGDPAEFAAITAAIPYEGVVSRKFEISPESYKELFDFEMDETAFEIARLLSVVGLIENDVSSPAEIDQERALYGCIQSTKSYWTDKNNENYIPELMPIADSVSAKTGMPETMIWIADHVKKTAKYVFGDDFEPDLNKLYGFGYLYFEDEGVLTPPHRGGGYFVLPVIKSYEGTETGYKAEVVYLINGEGGTGPWRSEKYFDREDLSEYIETTDEIAEVTVKKQPDGRLTFESCFFK